MLIFFFTARCHANAVYAIVSRLSQGSNSTKQHRRIAQELLFSDAEDLGKIQTLSPPTEAPNAGGVC